MEKDYELKTERMEEEKYLSEPGVIDLKDFEHGILNLICAPCGSGKTTFIEKVLCNEAIWGEPLLYLINSKSGLEAFKKRGEERYYNGEVYYVHPWIRAMTYATFAMLCIHKPEEALWSNDLSIIACDELHSCVEWSRIPQKNPNDTQLHKRALEEIHKRIHNGAMVVAIDATPQDIRKEFRDEFQEIPVHGKLKSYKIGKTIYYQNLFNVLKELPTDKTGLIYVPRIELMLDVYDELSAMGINCATLWSMSNEEYQMSVEDLAVRKSIIERETIPKDIQVCIINAAYETALNIKSPVDYVLVNSTREQSVTQVIGRVRHDVETVYLLTKDNEELEIVIPEHYLNRPLKAKDKDALCEDLGLVNKQNNRMLKWPSFRKLFGSLFPTFFYRKSDTHLNATYKYEDVEKELKSENANPHSLLYRLVKLIDVPTHDFLLAVRAGSEGRVESIRRRIQKRAEEKINRPFREFYKTEDISLHISFNANVVTFLVQSGDGEALTFSERSNGLRWYLETFIDARANNISDRNVVYLLDEPGVSLHVNAQRELLSLFEHLANQGNQVVYTTHSPYMLNTKHEGIHCIRAVVKDETGFSRIYKNAYDARIAQESQQDTLAPIIAALGMNLNDTFGPAKDKINIVTEGMSDYIYLNTMVKQLGISMEKCVFIPSVGATNCVHICQILHGWGCRYMALFDYDRTGVESGGEYMRKKMLFEEGKQYCYIKNVSSDEIARKTYVASPYMIEDVMIYSEIERFCEETGNAKTLGKPLTAKLMCAAIESGTFIVSPKSLENFKQLLEKVLSLHK